MRFLIPILFIYLSSCCGCGETHDITDNLIDFEVDEVMTGYSDYRDSIGGEIFLFDRFSIMRDTALMSDFIYHREGKIKNLFLFADNFFLTETYDFSNEPISHYRLKGVTFLKTALYDSLQINNLNYFRENNDSISPITVYCISKPFRPDTSNHAVIQEFPMIDYSECGMPEARSLFYKKISGRWKFQFMR